MPNVTMREMLEAGVHFGHQTHHWHPKMKPYVFGARNGIYIINLKKTVENTKEACDFVRKVTSEGKRVLFVGTKKQAKSIIREEAKRADMPYVTNRWLGGMLTNYTTVKASIDRMKKIEAMKETEEWTDITKKEQSRFEKAHEKLDKSLGGLADMKRLPGALFVVDVIKEHIAIKEAKKLGIPTIALVDTNSNPDNVDYVIPGNDDALRSVGLFSRLISDSCIEGERAFKEKLRANKVEEEEEIRVEKTESKFEGDIEIEGVDVAELEAMQESEEESTESSASEEKSE